VGRDKANYSDWAETTKKNQWAGPDKSVRVSLKKPGQAGQGQTSNEQARMGYGGGVAWGGKKAE